MNAQRQLSARRAGAERLAIVDYLAIYCATCGRVGYAARCGSGCAKIVCVDRGSCHPGHHPRASGDLATPAARSAWTVTLGK